MDHISQHALGHMLCSYERRAAGAAAVVAVGVAPRQVGRGHEREALVGAAVLSQRVHALLAVGLPSVRHRAAAVSVPRHQIHAVLREKSRSRLLTGSNIWTRLLVQVLPR